MNSKDCSLDEITELYFNMYNKVISPLLPYIIILNLGCIGLVALTTYLSKNTIGCTFIFSVVFMVFTIGYSVSYIFKSRDDGWIPKYDTDESIVQKYLGKKLLKNSLKSNRRFLWYKFHILILEDEITRLEDKIESDKNKLGVIYDSDDLKDLIKLKSNLNKLTNEFNSITN